MAQVNQELNVQCFVKKNVQSSFSEDSRPRLLYVGRTSPAASAHPRIMHAHPDLLELLLIVDGTADYFVHDKMCRVQAGDLLVYNAGVVHDEFPGSGVQMESYCAAIGGLHMPGLRENALISDEGGYIFPCGQEFDDIRMLFEMMYRNLAQDKPSAEVVCDSLMHVLLEKVLVLTGHPEQAGAETPPQEIGMQVKEYIDAHFCEPITLQHISQALNFSPYYLSHIFKQMSGYSPIQYLLRRRIGEAQTLLITTNLSVSRISEMVGYETQSYFNLQFTKYIGMSPNRFRKNFVVNDIALKRGPERKNRRGKP